MKIKKFTISGPLLIYLDKKTDKRGYFQRIFCEDALLKYGVKFNIVQANSSFNYKKGTVRGMHYQKAPYPEEKIVKCIKGEIYDVLLDIRKNSATFGKWVSVVLSQKDNTILYIPSGFAHGFQTLTDETEILYLMSEYYSPKNSTGYRWNDPGIQITWPLKKIIISKKDSELPLLFK
ncbi:MAG: dTDP-4-dehydrorhamnose 3,5-epimerase [Patescibacteria group bacterium]|nr:dTDP-4-dehydrorhamnose 3,5-epimerase [Patescibacteria group bacterium]